MSKNVILQFNFRYLKANLNELQLLVQQYNPIVVSLQGTFTKDGDTASLKRYTLCTTLYVQLRSR